MLYRTGMCRNRRAGDCTVHNLHHICILSEDAMLESWLCVSMILHTACFVSQEVALGTPPGFEKLKHVFEILFGFSEEMGGCVLLMT